MRNGFNMVLESICNVYVIKSVRSMMPGYTSAILELEYMLHSCVREGKILNATDLLTSVIGVVLFGHRAGRDKG